MRVGPQRRLSVKELMLSNWYWRRLMRVPWGIKPVNPRGNQPRVFTGRTDAEAEVPVLCPPDAKSWLTGKDRDAGKDWGQEKRVTEYEMVGWHYQLSGLGFEQTPEIVKDREAWRAAVHGSKSWTHLRDWTTTVLSLYLSFWTYNLAWKEEGQLCVGSVSKYMWNACYT